MNRNSECIPRKFLRESANEPKQIKNPREVVDSPQLARGSFHSLLRLFAPGPLCVALCLLFVLVGLWPFEFFPDNRVAWTQDPIGLRFRGEHRGLDHGAGGIAFTPHPLIGMDGSGSFSIEIKLRCNHEPRTSVPGIVILCDEEKKPALFLGQWKSSLIVRRISKDIRRGKKWKEASVYGGLTEGNTRLITIVSDGSGSVLYVDGRLEKRFPRLVLVPESGSPGGHYLLLGNTPEATNGWMGDIFGLALYDRVLGEEEVMENYLSWNLHQEGKRGERKGLILRYPFQKISGDKVEDSSGRGNDLLIPPHARFKSRVLAPLEIVGVSRNRFIKDVLINIIGFIPLGFFLCVFLARRTRFAVPVIVGVATSGGAAISLFIELVQSQIPVRTSSAADLMSNALGTFLGGLLFIILTFHNNTYIPSKELRHE